MEPELINLINEWRKVAWDSSGRDNLDETDLFWRILFRRYPELHYPEGQLLYRIHHGGDAEPEFTDYADWGWHGASSQKELFEQRHDEWEEQRDPSKIRFDGHWVSFTKDLGCFAKPYYKSKSLRGLVIVLKPQEAVDISSIPAWAGIPDEQEVVAPMNRPNLIEILPFDDAISKYQRKR